MGLFHHAKHYYLYILDPARRLSGDIQGLLYECSSLSILHVRFSKACSCTTSSSATSPPPATPPCSPRWTGARRCERCGSSSWASRTRASARRGRGAGATRCGTTRSCSRRRPSANGLWRRQPRGSDR